jgi:cell wall-associated NlpC family hydrolase
MSVTVRHAFGTLLAGALLLTLAVSCDRPAHAQSLHTAPVAAQLTISTQALSSSVSTPRQRAFAWAKGQAGCWYRYGHTGPCSHGFDCSGLVYAAYRHVGAYFGRDTSAMLRSHKLVRTTHPYPGDLAFFGTGHVELYVSGSKYNGVTFGAHHSGTRVGFRHYSSYYHPTAFYHVWGTR